MDMLLMVPRLTLLLAPMIVAGLGSQAWGWSFDEARGQIATTGAVSWSCEGAPEGLGVTVYDDTFTPTTEDELLARVETLDEPLEGSGAVRLGMYSIA
ncbi:MAG: hypothetical protein AAFX99_04440 [Myxococcota bacterium]